MRYVILSIFTLLLNVFAFGQATSQQTNPDIEIIKQTWIKERIAWENSGFSAPNETFNEMRDRVRTERRPTSALEERSIKAANEDKKKPTEPPRYVFRYKLVVQNNSTKAIRELDWDYIFIDASTGEEMGRRQFTSVEKVGAGKKKELSVRVSSPPTHTISVYKVGTGEGAGLNEKIEISRILYDDGSEWKAPVAQ